MGFVYLFLYFVVVDNAITLFNCFFFDLAINLEHAEFLCYVA